MRAIPGYTLYHTIHADNKAHGGTALIITRDYEIDKFQREFL